MDYYRLLADLETPTNKWQVDSVISETKRSIWDYVTVKGDITDSELEATLRKKGTPTDFTFADFEVLVVNAKIKDLISADEAQFIRLKIHESDEAMNFFLLYVRNECDCVDEQLSIFDKFEKDDPIRPDKAGQYKTIYKLVVDRAKTQNLNILRIKGYNVAVIISELLKQKMEESGVTGVLYQKITL